GDARRAVPLEEGRLRLDRRDLPGDRLEGAAGELPHALGVVAQSPGLQQRRMRVDPGEDRPVLRDRLLQPRAEGGAHAPAPAGCAAAAGSGAEASAPRAEPARAAAREASSRATWSCRLVTAKEPSGSASMACTAAWNSCIVVMIGTSTLVAAARM